MPPFYTEDDYDRELLSNDWFEAVDDIPDERTEFGERLKNGLSFFVLEFEIDPTNHRYLRVEVYLANYLRCLHKERKRDGLTKSVLVGLCRKRVDMAQEHSQEPMLVAVSETVEQRERVVHGIVPLIRLQETDHSSMLSEKGSDLMATCREVALDVCRDRKLGLFARRLAESGHREFPDEVVEGGA